MALRRKTPADRLFYAILGLSLALIAVIYCAVNQPSSHLRFEVKERQKFRYLTGRLILQDGIQLRFHQQVGRTEYS